MADTDNVVHLWKETDGDETYPLEQQTKVKVEKFIRSLEGILNNHDDDLTRHEVESIYEILEDLRSTRAKLRHPSGN